MRDAAAHLPPGAGAPQVGDDFGFVLGFLLAVTGDGFSAAELEVYANDLRREMGLVPGIARVDRWGVQDERIYVEVSQAQLATFGVTREAVARTLDLQNAVVDGGRVDVGDRRLRISPTGEFESPEDIANLVIGGNAELPGAPRPVSLGDTGEMVRVRDVASVRRGFAEPPTKLMRHDSTPAIALAAAPRARANVVEVGEALDARIAEVVADYPVGIEVHKIAWQADAVRTSIVGFMVNLAEAILIVLVVLALTMGLRMGILIGLSGLVFAILGTFIVMAVIGIDLQRVSLGALVIAMGMMVDNAIVVADGFVTRLRKGMERIEAAVESAGQTAVPPLGATLVAIMAFYPIFASPESTGEYARSLFQVVAISLLFSWLLSQTLTPVLCVLMLPDPERGAGDEDEYASPFFRGFRGVLGWALSHRRPVMAGLLALLAISIWSFRFVPQNFFPDSSREQLMIDYWLPEGTRIASTAAELEPVEQVLLTHSDLASVSTFVGSGPPRFYLPVDPELSHASYGQLIVNTTSLAGVQRVIEDMEEWLRENAPQALVRVRRYGVGSWNDWKFEARFSGPAGTQLGTLRALAAQGVSVLQASPLAKDARTNWRQRVLRLEPDYAQEQGRWAGVSRNDIAAAAKRASDGFPIGMFREGDDLIPIVVRSAAEERLHAAAALEELQVVPAFSARSIPLAAVTHDVNLRWEESSIHRFNRRRAITVQASPHEATFPELMEAVRADFESIGLPPGFQLEWDGQFASQQESLAALVPGLVPTVVIMLLIIVVLFNAFRPPLIIFAVIPFVLIGITLGLLVTQIPFGFMSLLGAMSLSGMMIKNSVVLLDEVDLNLGRGLDPYDAVVQSAMSRLRPVANAAATTILGMAPLLQDVFWISMAITIMAGLLLGTALTMIAVPLLYTVFYRVDAPTRP